MSDVQIRDGLARQRTEMANERTLLAYIRTALGFSIVGIPAIWWSEQSGMQGLGFLALAAGLVCLAVGLWRFRVMKAVIAATDSMVPAASRERDRSGPA